MKNHQKRIVKSEEYSLAEFIAHVSPVAANHVRAPSFWCRLKMAFSRQLYLQHELEIRNDLRNQLMRAVEQRVMNLTIYDDFGKKKR